MYRGVANFRHEQPASLGVLLANLGTPEAPNKVALRPYLKQFLSDPRVIEYPRLRWWIILNGIILNVRPKTSAKLYEKVWTEQGSPLLLYGQKQRDALQQQLNQANFGPVHVALGMCVGKPSIASALRELQDKAARAILVIPLYPQYSGTTTGSTFDCVTKELQRWRWLPEFRMIMGYHEEPQYISALANSVRELWQRDGEPQKLVMSFHGIPKRYFDGGDPYHCYCQKTARLLAEALQLPKDRYLVSFQSLFGKEEWLRPYTADTMAELPKLGVKSVDVICPGFSADCLETLEEIEEQNKEFFCHAGGERFRYIPALNDRPDFISLLSELVQRNVSSLLPGWNSESAISQASTAQAHFLAMKTR